MPPMNEHGFLAKEIEQWIPKNRKAHREFFQLVDDTNRCCQTSMYTLEPHKTNRQEVLVSTLYLRLLNNAQAAVVLAERGLMPQCRILGRATVEVLFILCAVANSREHAEDYVSEHQKNRLKYLNKYRQLHGGLPPDANREEVEKLEQEIREEIDHGEIRSKTTEQWARDADMHDWYLTVYAVFSDSVHSKVNELEKYLVLDDKNEIAELRWGPEDYEIEKVLMTLIQAMLTALGCSRRLFRQDDFSDVSKLQKRLDTLVRERLVGNE